MKKVYINGMGCISAQPTFDSVFLETAVINTTDNVLSVVAPPYKDFIPPAASRRMGKGVKNAIVATTLALKEAGDPALDAIITGTGMGCIEDSEKFLRGILDNQEEFLTPTSFIQSTHNTVGGQIALGLQCKAYNFTYVNGGNSFESGLLDASMQLISGEANTVLTGGIDESAEFTINFFKVAGLIKKAEDQPFALLDATTTGSVFGEGATFFVLENEKKASSYAELVAVNICNSLSVSEAAQEVVAFIQKNNYTVSDIDAVVLGYSGDVVFDEYYKVLSVGLFKEIPQLYYKHLSGEYHTASAFGLWMAAKILKTQGFPEMICTNTPRREQYKTILLYNQFRGEDHSFILLRQC